MAPAFRRFARHRRASGRFRPGSPGGGRARRGRRRSSARSRTSPSRARGRRRRPPSRRCPSRDACARRRCPRRPAARGAARRPTAPSAPGHAAALRSLSRVYAALPRLGRALTCRACPTFSFSATRSAPRTCGTRYHSRFPIRFFISNVTGAARSRSTRSRFRASVRARAWRFSPMSSSVRTSSKPRLRASAAR